MKLEIGNIVRPIGWKSLIVGAMPAKWVIMVADGFVLITANDSDYTPLGLYDSEGRIKYVVMQSPNEAGGHIHTMHRALNLQMTEDGAEIFDCDFVETPVFLMTPNGAVNIDS